MDLLRSLPAGGTLFNAVAVVLGSIVGLALGRFIPSRLHDDISRCVGLFTLCLGVEMAREMEHALAVLLSLVLGALVGGWLELDARLNGLGDAMKERLHVGDARFTEGFVTATLLFCIGAMTIIGAFDDGARHDPSLLVTKGTMDGIESIVLSSSLGIGVMFSVLPMLVYQGLLTFLAAAVEGLVTPGMYADISGLGGAMILGIGLNLLKIARLRLCDMLPALLFIVPFSLLAEKI